MNNLIAILRTRYWQWRFNRYVNKLNKNVKKLKIKIGKELTPALQEYIDEIKDLDA